MKFKEGDTIECIIPYGNISIGDTFLIREIGTNHVNVETIKKPTSWISPVGSLNIEYVEKNYRSLNQQLELEF